MTKNIRSFRLGQNDKIRVPDGKSWRILRSTRDMLAWNTNDAPNAVIVDSYPLDFPAGTRLTALGERNVIAYFEEFDSDYNQNDSRHSTVAPLQMPLATATITVNSLNMVDRRNRATFSVTIVPGDEPDRQWSGNFLAGGYPQGITAKSYDGSYTFTGQVPDVSVGDEVRFDINITNGFYRPESRTFTAIVS